MRSYRLWPITLLLLLALTPPPVTAAEPVTRDWPGTRAGALAQGWVRAFTAGEDSMRAFLTANMATASLTERNVSTRITRYREMRETYGKFQLGEVVKSEPALLAVKLLDAKAKPYDAEFTLEAQPPFKLKAVTLRTRVGGGHSLFNGFHH
ncbi:MAG: hypothetical protein ABL977_00965 [Candidatus Eisenbacteria bacterium]